MRLSHLISKIAGLNTKRPKYKKKSSDITAAKKSSVEKCAGQSVVSKVKHHLCLFVERKGCAVECLSDEG